jgi:ABC-2 type transport system permease protein
MSAGEAPARPISGRFLRSELRLVAARRRNQVALAALAAVPVLMAVALRADGPDPAGRGGGPAFVFDVLDNGYFVALAGLTLEISLLLPVAVAMLSADAVAGEAGQGTLRYLLAVPVGRTRLLAVKYAGIVAGAFLAPAVVAATGVVAGLLLFGGGDATLLSGTPVGMGEALLRLAGICLYIGVCLAALGAIGLFLSTLTEQPAAATIALTMLTVASHATGQIGQLAWLHPYLPTRHWEDFGELLRTPVALDALRPGLLSAAAYAIVFLTAAWARFGGRDITS